MSDTDTVNVRYLVDDVAASVEYYTRHFGFTVGISSPAFADVTRGNLRLLLSGPKSSAGRAMTDGERPGPGGWNRIHFIVDDLDSEIARLTDEGVQFRNEVVTGPGGWNRIHFIVDDLASEVERLKGEGLEFRNDIVSGPGGQQILLLDPSGNIVELFQPAG